MEACISKLDMVLRMSLYDFYIDSWMDNFKGHPEYLCIIGNVS